MNQDIKVFNKKNRTSNSIKTSFFGALKSALDILFGFAYRTVFINTLGADYLGLNGLFTNILQVLSLAELGITTAIVYRFYEPISNNDVSKVGKLMNYLKKVYRYIAAFIFIAGVLLTPFIKSFINDSSTIPNDVNIYVIYLLFLLNTVSSYLFVYRQTILSADQRGYIQSVTGIFLIFIKYLVQIILLYITRDYTVTLVAGIVITLICNIIVSCWTSTKYKEVFDVKELLDDESKKEIISDTKAVMFHKVGATVKLSTDSIILSKFVSLVSAGIYSNYSMIISGLQALIGQVLGSFVSSVGNAHVELTKEKNYEIYKKLLFIDLWISSVTVTCTYLLINDFIKIWIGKKYIFDKITLIMLCVQFYIIISRQINISYTNGCGLFNRDKYRPLIEAFLNLVLSIIGVKMWGIVGVFIGTVVSSVLTVCWREPSILFKEEFRKPVIIYWKMYFSFFLCAIIFCLFGDYIKTRYMMIDSVFMLLVEAFAIFLLINFIFIFLFRKKDEFSQMIELLKKLRIHKSK